MTVEFALLASPARDAATETRLQRFRQLPTRPGNRSDITPQHRDDALYEDDDIHLWVNRSDALLQLGALTLCGRIRPDNRPALLEKLTQSPGLPEELSDLALVLQLCAAHGPEALQWLSGSFALVLWNRDTRELHVIRDHFGTLPVYLVNRPEQMVLASDLRLAAHLDGHPLRPRLDTVSAYLMGFSDGETGTAFADLERLPKAHLLQWQPGSAPMQRRYWQLELPEVMPLAAAVPALRQELTRAVQVRRGNPQETGCMLSGGLDSSTIAVLAAPPARAAAPALRTLSFVYRETDSYDESRFIADVNEKIGADPELIRVEGAPQPDQLRLLLEEQFDLCPAPGLLKSRRIYAEAQARGMTALLDGHGGDEVISHGYLRQAELAAQGAYFRLWREMRGAARVYGQPLLEPYLLYIHRYAPLPRHGLVRRAVGWIGRRIEVKPPFPIRFRTLLDETFCKDQDVEARQAKAEQSYGAPPDAPDERLAHLGNLSIPLMSQAFEVLHRSAAAQGIEPIYPFFDKALVQLCLSVPSEGKLRDGWSRRILRDAMEGLLPPTVQWRPDKANFSSELSEFILAYLEDADRWHRVNTSLAGIVDLGTFEKWYDLLRDGPKDSAATVIQILWRSIYLAAWLERLDHWNACQQEGTLW